MGKAKDKAARVQMLPVEQIEASPYQARTTFDDTEIAALAVSILQNGLLQPVSVRRTGVHKYQLIAGERRLRACRLARLERVPALVVDYTDSESAALGLLENLQRAQLDPFDTARGIREVIRLWGCTQAEAARRLGLSQSALANKLRLLSLTPAQQQLCLANRLTERHARAALRLPENRRTAALEKMARDGLSVREADKLVDAMLSAPKNAPSPARRSVPMVRDVRFFVNTLQHAVDMMTQKGIAATATCGRRDGCLEYTVRIPVGEDGVPGAFAVVPAPLPAAAPAAPRSPKLPGAGEGLQAGQGLQTPVTQNSPVLQAGINSQAGAGLQAGGSPAAAAHSPQADAGQGLQMGQGLQPPVTQNGPVLQAGADSQAGAGLQAGDILQPGINSQAGAGLQTGAVLQAERFPQPRMPQPPPLPPPRKMSRHRPMLRSRTPPPSPRRKICGFPVGRSVLPPLSKGGGTAAGRDGGIVLRPDAV